MRRRRLVGPGEHPDERALRNAAAALDCTGEGCGRGFTCHRCQARADIETMLRRFGATHKETPGGES